METQARAVEFKVSAQPSKKIWSHRSDLEKVAEVGAQMLLQLAHFLEQRKPQIRYFLISHDWRLLTRRVKFLNSNSEQSQWMETT